MADETTNSSHGETARPARVIGIAVYFNPEDPNFTVWTQEIPGAELAPIALAQMMLDEAARQLDIARRMANGKALARQMAEEQQNANLTKELTRGMHS
jgi:hypothetical protein